MLFSFKKNIYLQNYCFFLYYYLFFTYSLSRFLIFPFCLFLFLFLSLISKERNTLLFRVLHQSYRGRERERREEWPRIGQTETPTSVFGILHFLYLTHWLLNLISLVVYKFRHTSVLLSTLDSRLMLRSYITKIETRPIGKIRILPSLWVWTFPKTLMIFIISIALIRKLFIIYKSKIIGLVHIFRYVYFVPRIEVRPSVRYLYTT